jgi:hypothetical protein
MKRLLALLLFPLAVNAAEILNPDYVEQDTKPWEELAAHLPPYPREENLLPFTVSSATSNKFMIDAASLSLGADLVIRYTVVIESPRGARTVSYEGLRCESAERKIYGFGHPDGKWTENKRAAWEGIKVRSLLSYHKPLFEEYFCPNGIRIRNAEEGIRNLKRGGGDPY